MAASGISRTSWWSHRRRRSRIRRSGSPPGPHSIARAASRGFNLILDQYASPKRWPSASRIYKAARVAQGLAFDPMQVTVARLAYVAKDRADPRRSAGASESLYRPHHRGLARAGYQSGAGRLARTGYADRKGATEEHALFGTPDELGRMIEDLRKAGVGYVLLMIFGGQDQLRRFAREIMPVFTQQRAAAE